MSLWYGTLVVGSELTRFSGEQLPVALNLLGHSHTNSSMIHSSCMTDIFYPLFLMIYFIGCFKLLDHSR